MGVLTRRDPKPVPTLNLTLLKSGLHRSLLFLYLLLLTPLNFNDHGKFKKIDGRNHPKQWKG
jgi:hypothetical protein